MNSATSPASKPGVHVIELPRQLIERTSRKFPEGVNVLIAAPDDLAEVFIRPPKAGETCPVTSLPRSTLLDVLKRAGPDKVPCRHLRAPGATTGITLIPRQKLIDYINEQPPPEWLETEEEE